MDDAEAPPHRLGAALVHPLRFDRHMRVGVRRRGAAEAPVQFDVFRQVWPQAAALRRNGTLLKLAAQVRCPVVAIHGEYDPHPAAGVGAPLARAMRSFRFVVLDRCGHEPWNERHAREQFYAILRAELS